MLTCRYRFNRASGKIYRENSTGLVELSESLDTIILHATPVVYGQPFPNLMAQDWINLCFLDPQMNWSFALLNSGQSDALRPFLNYQIQQGQNLFNQLTRITLIPQTSRLGRRWYTYSFEAHPLPVGINLLQILQKNSHFPLIDPTIDLSFPEPKLDFLNFTSPPPPQFSIQLVDQRTPFLSWD